MESRVLIAVYWTVRAKKLIQTTIKFQEVTRIVCNLLLQFWLATHSSAAASASVLEHSIPESSLKIEKLKLIYVQKNLTDDNNAK